MAAFSSAGMEARSQLSQGVLRLKDNPVLPRFGFPICLRACPEISESTFERVKYGFTTDFSYHMLWW